MAIYIFRPPKEPKEAFGFDVNGTSIVIEALPQEAPALSLDKAKELATSLLQTLSEEKKPFNDIAIYTTENESLADALNKIGRSFEYKRRENLETISAKDRQELGHKASKSYLGKILLAHFKAPPQTVIERKLWRDLLAIHKRMLHDTRARVWKEDINARHYQITEEEMNLAITRGSRLAEKVLFTEVFNCKETPLFATAQDPEWKHPAGGDAFWEAKEYYRIMVYSMQPEALRIIYKNPVKTPKWKAQYLAEMERLTKDLDFRTKPAGIHT